MVVLDINIHQSQEVKDDCGTAGAAVVRSVIGEQVSVEVYDDEEDFEEYD